MLSKVERRGQVQSMADSGWQNEMTIAILYLIFQKSFKKFMTYSHDFKLYFFLEENMY